MRTSSRFLGSRVRLGFWSLALLILAGALGPAVAQSFTNTRPTRLWVADPQGLSPAEQALLASLQGNLNRSNAVVWVRGRGANARVLRELESEGTVLETPRTLWDLVEHFRSEFRGFLTCAVTNASLNVATSLAGPRRALIADASLRERLLGLGFTELADVRSLNELDAFAQFGSEFRKGLAVHQPISKVLPLRDFAVAQGAFTFFDVAAADRKRLVRTLGPTALVFGWGSDERDFVGEVSAGGGGVIPSDWALNLSALPHLHVPIPPRPRGPTPRPAEAGERVVAFVVTDGDNVQWLLNGFTDAPGFWANSHRGEFPVTWELAPSLADLAPRVLAHLYRTATTNDDFIAGPSGAAYWFPSLSPDPTAMAALTAQSLGPAQLQMVSVLNSGGGLDAADPFLATSAVAGVFYKDYAPYHRFAGAVRWHLGKPIVSYRFLLWEQKRSDGSLKPELIPEGVAAAIERLPAEADRNLASFAVVNVHAWSFGSVGGPMEAIAQTVSRLPPKTRVVTATDFLALLAARAPR